MKIILALMILGFANLASAADLIPEAASVSSLVATGYTCGTTSDCKTSLATITASLEARGFTILKTDACSSHVVYETCSNGNRPTEVGRIYFVR